MNTYNQNYMPNFRSTFLSVLLIVSMAIVGQDRTTQFERLYKVLDSVKLKLLILQPKGFQKAKTYPAIVFFFGGGWQTGDISQFNTYAAHCVERGMMAVLVDYRVQSRQKTTPFESLKDAKSAMRYIRSHALEFNVDPNRIIAAGGSAGGHLAAACFTNETINESGDDLKINPKPNALVLFNPVIDNSKSGYGYERIGERYLEFSPLHNIHKGFPPTLFFLGRKDNLIPVATAESFKQKVDSVGGYCELYLFEGKGHGFFNEKGMIEEILPKMDAFFRVIEVLKN